MCTPRGLAQLIPFSPSNTFDGRSRWNDYVFVANDPKSLAALDKHVEAAADEVAMPLVVVGELGEWFR